LPAQGQAATLSVGFRAASISMLKSLGVAYD
jgi:hypothetical protein